MKAKKMILICSIVMVFIITSAIPVAAAVAPPSIEPMAEYYNSATASIAKVDADSVTSTGNTSSTAGIKAGYTPVEYVKHQAGQVFYTYKYKVDVGTY